MASDWIVVEARVTGCAAEVYVNDVPVAQVGLGQSRSVALPVNQYAVKGANALLLVVNPGPAPASAREPRAEPLRAKGATAVATLTRYRKGAVSGDGSGTVLATASWAGRDDNEPERFPAEVRATAEVPLALGPWAWQTADDLVLDEETGARVASLVDVVRSGLEAGDVSSFLELATRGLREIARAYDDSPDEGVTTLREVVQHGRGAAHWRFPPLPREGWSLRLVAGARMVECIAKDWEPIVRSLTDAEENSFAMPMLVGRVGGQWVILR